MDSENRDIPKQTDEEAPVSLEEFNSNNKSKRNFTAEIRKNPWILSTLVLGVIVLILLVGNFGTTGNVITGNVVSDSEAGDKILDFVKSQTGGQGDLVGVESFNDYFYEVTIEFQGEEIPLYLSKDGTYFTSSLLDLNEINKDVESQAEEISIEVAKSDKPVVELFVMTHCPYGTQAEKGFIPTINALENSVDAKIRFVHYFMHEPEETETPRQVCIREEQSDKWYVYLECFLEDGNSDRCIKETKVDEAKMQECIDNGNAERYYKEDSALSESYGVRGSPTLVINGAQVNSGRDSASFLTAICSAFNTASEICETVELSSTSPSPGFGWEGTGSSTSAQC
ncbi:MAG: thioredoxin domain-containing protein [archaeon]